MNKVGLILAVSVAALAMCSIATAYDRQPVTISGATVDGFGATISKAEIKLRTRYPKAHGIRCTGALMTGHMDTSSWMEGIHRVWDKLHCTVGTISPVKGISLVFDVKTANDAFLVYRVKPWTNTAAAPQPTTVSPPVSPSPSSGGSVVSIAQGNLKITKVTSATVNSDRSVTVNWYLAPDTDSALYFNHWWELDGGTIHNYGEGDWRRTQLKTRPLSSGRHTVSLHTGVIYYTNTYYDDCKVASRDDYLFYCGFADSATVTVNIR